MMHDQHQPPTHYDTLEINPIASQEVIRAAYKALMQRYHPDKDPNNPFAEDMAMRIAQAYETLSDPEKRLAYDNELRIRSHLCEQTCNDNTIQAHYTHGDQQLDPDHLARSQSSDTASINQTTRGNKEEKLGVNPLYILLIVSISIIILLFVISELISTKEEALAPMPAPIVDEKVLTQAIEGVKNKRAEEQLVRTIPELASNIIIEMQPNLGEWCRDERNCKHYLIIPTLGVVVNANKADAVINNIVKYKGTIMENIKRKINGQPYTNLIRLDSEVRLKGLIQQVINDTIVGDPDPGSNDFVIRPGVEDVLLPQSFTVR